MGEADSLVSQAELSRRWGVSSRTVNRRLVFLGIMPQRRGRHHYLSPEQVALAERFHQHLSQGRDSDSFNPQCHEALEAEVEVVLAEQPNQEITLEQLTTPWPRRCWRNCPVPRSGSAATVPETGGGLRMPAWCSPARSQAQCWGTASAVGATAGRIMDFGSRGTSHRARCCGAFLAVAGVMGR
ncbi:MAG: hypothetical protein TE42_07790 [Candidatus Synechococcus spongiarum SP3]|uniref:Uncharacterized protein n=1 Tax=Candidatus Synechococcus spongiarum SP3 TaxID=1604020 RepID=A0A0G2HJZ2_9SYNE|nr:MAG: hypothetical protein TE42_07790 [Candidatus Synechococcus spongiarum SP3]